MYERDCFIEMIFFLYASPFQIRRYENNICSVERERERFVGFRKVFLENINM